MPNPTRRTAATTAAAVTAALLMTACGPATPTGGAQAPNTPTPVVPSSPTDTDDSPFTATPQPTGLPSTAPIAQTRGDEGIVGLIYRVERRDGILTVSGGALNTGNKDFYASAWGYSMAGSSLIDRKEGKRYLPLEDAKGTCICTKIERIIEPGETRLLYASFQAPPASTTVVDLQLGNMQPVKITIPAE